MYILNWDTIMSSSFHGAWINMFIFLFAFVYFPTSTIRTNCTKDTYTRARAHTHTICIMHDASLEVVHVIKCHNHEY